MKLRRSRVLASIATIVAHGVGMPAGAQAATCGGQVATITGTEGNDTLDGTPSADVIIGLAGTDTITGGGGNDLICGHNGADQLHGIAMMTRCTAEPGTTPSTATTLCTVKPARTLSEATRLSRIPTIAPFDIEAPSGCFLERRKRLTTSRARSTP